ncbi:MAG: hypothetical protein AAF327_24630 [Cyanobacteria bacterium P01_A01_bin.37]
MSYCDAEDTLLKIVETRYLAVFGQTTYMAIATAGYTMASSLDQGLIAFPSTD